MIFVALVDTSTLELGVHSMVDINVGRCSVIGHLTRFWVSFLCASGRLVVQAGSGAHL